jgi:phosphate transport system substrate-binding protein
VHIPTVLGAVVPIFNVTGVSDMKFSPDVLADIFLGKISTWSDPRIAKDNPGVKLPNRSINVVHRAEGSGTTFIFTDYLAKVSKDWANGPGRGRRSTGRRASAARASEGVAGLVRQLPGAIGYVELIYAMQNHIAFGEVKNRRGTGSRLRSPASPKPLPA